MKKFYSLVAAFALFGGCGVEQEDGADDTFAADGKADGGYSAAEQAGALRAANELTLSQLDNDVALSSRAAKNIVTARAAGPFASLAELDAVPYVGPVALGKLVDYARAQGWISQSSLAPLARVRGSGIVPDGRFGAWVAVDGTTLATSAPQQGNAGLVFLFNRGASGWTEATTLTPHETGVEMFGYEIAISGDTIAITGRLYDATSAKGVVEIFVRTGSTYAYQTSFVGEDYTFGSFIALSGDRLAVTTPSANAIDVYDRTAGHWSTPVRISDTNAGDTSWPRAISLDGDTLAAAAGNAVDVFTHAGTTWSSKRINACGESVALQADTLVVGCTTETGPQNLDHSGGARVFTRSGTTWTQKALLFPATPMRLGEFGSSVALDGGRIAIGAPAEGKPEDVFPYSNQAGAMYVFDSSGTAWTQTVRLTQLTPVHNSQFGETVVVSGDTVAATAFGEGEWVHTSASNEEFQILGAVYAN